MANNQIQIIFGLFSKFSYISVIWDLQEGQGDNSSVIKKLLIGFDKREPNFNPHGAGEGMGAGGMEELEEVGGGMKGIGGGERRNGGNRRRRAEE